MYILIKPINFTGLLLVCCWIVALKKAAFSMEIKFQELQSKFFYQAALKPVLRNTKYFLLQGKRGLIFLFVQYHEKKSLFYNGSTEKIHVLPQTLCHSEGS